MTRRGRKPPKRVREAPQDLSAAIEALTFEVPPDEHKLRIDRFLSERLTWRSRTSILELLSEGQVSVEGEVVTKKSHKLRQGERVAVTVPPPDEPERHEELAHELEERILHEDEDLIVINKPPGLVVHPVGRIRVNTLIQALHWRFRHGAGAGEEVLGGSRPGQLGPVIPRICHRLDRDTSGVLVVAKNAQARSRMQSVIEGAEVEKVYLACVHGRPDPSEGDLQLAIGRDPDAENEIMMAIRPEGLAARTHYAVGETIGELSWVRFQIFTGRQHQIRVHAQALGTPVLCDALYGLGETVWPTSGEAILTRQALHAHRMAFPRAQGLGQLELEAPLPADLSALRASQGLEEG
ncbi:MAG: RluA family pseudouridine synthase [Planctomycetes bacterium]|nr:RluA family pseudouridine synthase [Planctomycetota bacterium]